VRLRNGPGTSHTRHGSPVVILPLGMAATLIPNTGGRLGYRLFRRCKAFTIEGEAGGFQDPAIQPLSYS